LILKKSNSLEENMDLSVVLTFTTLFCVMFLFIGLIGGWIFKQYQVERIYGIRNIHPEFFDNNGNIIPDEVLAVRFEEGFFDDEEEIDDD
jgi:hypothetical protein